MLSFWRATLFAYSISWITGCHVDAAATQEAGETKLVPTEAAGARAHYLANAGVLVEDGETKVVFDPLFRNDYGTFQLVPEEVERALFAGRPPFDGIDAVFISHYHEDHFSPSDVLRLLKEHGQLRVYAPQQAVTGMKRHAVENDAPLFDRVEALSLEYKDAPLTIEEGALLIEAVRIPHSGWPERQRHVENIAYRVTLDATTTVLHLGDADARDEHFAHDGEHWDRRRTNVAFPPYWYFLSDEGRRVLDHRLRPRLAIGVHVPRDVPRNPEDRADELRERDLFVSPGETRAIPR